MKRIFFFTLSVLCISFIGLPVLQTALGYFPGAPGWKVAKLAAERGEVELCNRIVDLPWGMFSMGPSVAESQFLCIHEYAKLTKDPSVCALLMPSSYGWSCLGGAEKPNSRQCWFDFGPDPAEVGSGNTYVTLPECKSDPKEMQVNRCCEMARILYIENREDCAALRDSDILFDQCQELLARRERDIQACSSIRNEHVRASCEVAVRALKQK